MPRRYIPYAARTLKRRAQSLRREPTPAERKLWYEYLSTLDCKFTRQKPLGRYIADFYCASRRMVIELEGDSHYTDHSQRYDQTRANVLRGLGIRVLRFTNAEVMESFEAVCLAVGEALQEER